MFIAIVFIAELIIALNLIMLIVKADKKVREINDCVTVFNPLAETFMQYVRCLVKSFNSSFTDVIEFFKKKKEQVIFKTVVMIAIYALLIVFKLKTHKASKIYRLISAIRDLALEIAT